MRVARAALVALTASLLGGCVTTPPPPEAFHAALNQEYRLDAGDRLRVTVFEQDSLSAIYAVDKAGYLSLPLIGSVPARGKTPDEVRLAITAALRNGFLRDPDVSVQVEQYRPFFVMGEVATGGQYSYVPGMTVQNAVAIAGGFSPRAEKRNVDITRQVNGKVITGRVVLSDPVLPGDTVTIRERLF
ncbi:polysaccharide biosynthesis/export family protein [uncultured Aureimonas sp.]|uniref:polysaccharide biosynthesis/export family protein n=1 Tax=uncultured Aureimonas sp. TaxID=1604662 RepID=UPI0025DC94AB|nr:polysaccharide biosynthesis/export family protein [uncultured Aureimonas sp.]